MRTPALPAFLLMGLLIHTATLQAAEPAQKWSAQMRGMLQTLSALLEDLSSQARFNDPKNKGRIDQNAQKLARLAHGLNASGMKAPDGDPSLGLIAGLFDKQVQHGAAELQRGNRLYARSVLRSVTGYCIACHTRSSAENAPVQLKTPSALSPFEKAEFLASTRQFNQSLGEFQKLVGDASFSQRQPIEWQKAVRYALALSVRVQPDPDKALEIVRTVLQTPGVPVFFKVNSANWEKQLSEWKSEGKREITSEDGYYTEAVRLLGKAKSLQRYPADRSADVTYLRASQLVHELLRRYPEGRKAPEALLLAGMTYEVLRDLDIWTLHDLYYESCIRRAPHTETARNCYQRLEESTYASYSGSGGLTLPSEVRLKLTELSGLSESNASQKP